MGEGASGQAAEETTRVIQISDGRTSGRRWIFVNCAQRRSLRDRARSGCAHGPRVRPFGRRFHRPASVIPAFHPYPPVMDVNRGSAGDGTPPSARCKGQLSGGWTQPLLPVANNRRRSAYFGGGVAATLTSRAHRLLGFGDVYLDATVDRTIGVAIIRGDRIILAVTDRRHPLARYT